MDELAAGLLVSGVGVLGVPELVAPGGALLQAAPRKASVTSIETILMTGRRTLRVAIFTRSRYVTEMSKPAHRPTPRAIGQWLSSKPPCAQVPHGTFQSPSPSQEGISGPSVPT